VSWLMRRMMNSAGLFVARPTLAMSVPAKITDGVLSCSETSTKKAFLDSRERNAQLFVRRQLFLPVALTRSVCYRAGAIASSNLLPRAAGKRRLDGEEEDQQEGA